VFKTNKISQGEYYIFLQELAQRYGVEPEPYKTLIKYTEYITLYESIDLLEIFEEVRKFEDSIKEKIFTDDYQRKLRDLSRFAELVKGLYELKLTNGDLSEMMRDTEKISAESTAAFIKDASLKYGVAIEGNYDLGKIFENIPTALSFYKTAEDRNSAMLANTVNRMQKDGQRVAALITGGYHTKGMTELLKQKETSYIVILPKFDASKGDRPYVAILTNKRDPYEDLIQGGKCQILADEYLGEGISDPIRTEAFIVDVIMTNLAVAAIEKKDLHSVAKLWIDSYGKAYEDLKAKGIIKEPAAAEKDKPFVWTYGYRTVEILKDGTIENRLSTPKEVEEYKNSHRIKGAANGKTPSFEERLSRLENTTKEMLAESIAGSMNKAKARKDFDEEFDRVASRKQAYRVLAEKEKSEIKNNVRGRTDKYLATSSNQAQVDAPLTPQGMAGAVNAISGAISLVGGRAMVIPAGEVATAPAPVTPPAPTTPTTEIPEATFRRLVQDDATFDQARNSLWFHPEIATQENFDWVLTTAESSNELGRTRLVRMIHYLVRANSELAKGAKGQENYNRITVLMNEKGFAVNEVITREMAIARIGFRDKNSTLVAPAPVMPPAPAESAEAIRDNFFRDVQHDVTYNNALELLKSHPEIIATQDAFDRILTIAETVEEKDVWQTAIRVIQHLIKYNGNLATEPNFRRIDILSKSPKIERYGSDYTQLEIALNVCTDRNKALREVDYKIRQSEYLDRIKGVKDGDFGVVLSLFTEINGALNSGALILSPADMSADSGRIELEQIKNARDWMQFMLSNARWPSGIETLNEAGAGALIERMNNEAMWDNVRKAAALLRDNKIQDPGKVGDAVANIAFAVDRLEFAKCKAIIEDALIQAETPKPAPAPQVMKGPQRPDIRGPERMGIGNTNIVIVTGIVFIVAFLHIAGVMNAVSFLIASGLGFGLSFLLKKYPQVYEPLEFRVSGQEPLTFRRFLGRYHQLIGFAFFGAILIFHMFDLEWQKNNAKKALQAPGIERVVPPQEQPAPWRIIPRQIELPQAPAAPRNDIIPQQGSPVLVKASAPTIEEVRKMEIPLTRGRYPSKDALKKICRMGEAIISTLHKNKDPEFKRNALFQMVMIQLVETELKTRAQFGGGPGRGFAQFEAARTLAEQIRNGNKYTLHDLWQYIGKWSGVKKGRLTTIVSRVMDQRWDDIAGKTGYELGLRLAAPVGDSLNLALTNINFIRRGAIVANRHDLQGSYQFWVKNWAPGKPSPQRYQRIFNAVQADLNEIIDNSFQPAGPVLSRISVKTYAVPLFVPFVVKGASFGAGIYISPVFMGVLIVASLLATIFMMAGSIMPSMPKPAVVPAPPVTPTPSFPLITLARPGSVPLVIGQSAASVKIRVRKEKGEEITVSRQSPGGILLPNVRGVISVKTKTITGILAVIIGPSLASAGTFQDVLTALTPSSAGDSMRTAIAAGMAGIGIILTIVIIIVSLRYHAAKQRKIETWNRDTREKRYERPAGMRTKLMRWEAAQILKGYFNKTKTPILATLIALRLWGIDVIPLAAAVAITAAIAAIIMHFKGRRISAKAALEAVKAEPATPQGLNQALLIMEAKMRNVLVLADFLRRYANGANPADDDEPITDELASAIRSEYIASYETTAAQIKSIERTIADKGWKNNIIDDETNMKLMELVSLREMFRRASPEVYKVIARVINKVSEIREQARKATELKDFTQYGADYEAARSFLIGQEELIAREELADVFIHPVIDKKLRDSLREFDVSLKPAAVIDAAMDDMADKLGVTSTAMLRRWYERDFTPNPAKKGPTLFQSLLDKDKVGGYCALGGEIVINGKLYLRDKESISQAKDDLRRAGHLVKFNCANVPDIGDLNFEVDPELIRLMELFGINVQEFFGKELLNAMKLRGADLYQGLAGQEPIVVALMNKSSAPFEDHLSNGFIGINQAILDKRVMGEVPEARMKTLLLVGITHELRHEADNQGTLSEEVLTDEDVRLTEELANEVGVDINDILNLLISVSSEKPGESLFTDKLEFRLAELLYPSNASEATMPAPLVEEEQAYRGWVSRIIGAARSRFRKSPIVGTDRWRNILTLVEKVAFEDTEGFSVLEDKAAGEIFIGTRKRAGAEQRIENVMRRSVYDKKFYAPCHDYNNSPINVVVYCYKIVNPSLRETLLKTLNASGRNYMGDASTPNRTTVGYFAQVRRKEYDVDPYNIKLKEGETQDERISNAASKAISSAKRVVETVNEDDRTLMDPAISMIELFRDFDAAVSDKVYDVADMARVEISKGRRSVLEIEKEAENKKAALARLGRIMVERTATKAALLDILRILSVNENTTDEMLMKTVSNIIDDKGQLRDGAADTLKKWENRIKEFIRLDIRMATGADLFIRSLEEFAFYLENPDGNFVESTVEMKMALDGAWLSFAESQFPIILFADKLDPVTLNSLLDKYNVQAIVTRRATITSHWVVFAKNRNIPVVIVDMPTARSFDEEVAQEFAALEKDKQQAANNIDKVRINRRIAVVRSDNEGRAEVVLKPFMPTVEFEKSAVLYEESLMRFARERTDAPCDAVRLGYTDSTVKLAANADTPEEVEAAVRDTSLGGSFAAAAGLVRTERLFEDRNVFEPENTEVKTNRPVDEYLKAFFDDDAAIEPDGEKTARKDLRLHLKKYINRLALAAKGKSVTLRMIDLQPDKKTLIHAMLVSRGIKSATGIDFYKTDLGKDILMLELETMLELSMDCLSLKVLFPLVSTKEDVGRLITKWVDEAGLVKDSALLTARTLVTARVLAGMRSQDILNFGEIINNMPIGIMIENDTAVDNIKDLLSDPAISFYSIGTNDLSRYVMTRVLGKDTLLDRDDDLDKINLSRLQPQVLSRIVEVFEAARDINRQLPPERRKEISICGEMASWYSFQVFLALKFEKLGIKAGEVPLTLSMAGNRIPEVSLFIRSVEKKDYSGVETFLSDNVSNMGVMSVDSVAKEIVRSVFDRGVYGDKRFKEIYEEEKSILKETPDQALVNPIAEKRTLFTLELISRTRGWLTSLPIGNYVGGLKPVSPAAVQAGAVQMNIEEAISPDTEIVEATLLIVNKAGVHARPATDLVKLISAKKKGGPTPEVKAMVIRGDKKETELKMDMMALMTANLARGVRIKFLITGKGSNSLLTDILNMSDKGGPVFTQETAPQTGPSAAGTAVGLLFLIGIFAKLYQIFSGAEIASGVNKVAEAGILSGLPVSIQIILATVLGAMIIAALISRFAGFSAHPTRAGPHIVIGVPIDSPADIASAINKSLKGRVDIARVRDEKELLAIAKTRGAIGILLDGTITAENILAPKFRDDVLAIESIKAYNYLAEKYNIILTANTISAQTREKIKEAIIALLGELAAVDFDKAVKEFRGTTMTTEKLAQIDNIRSLLAARRGELAKVYNGAPMLTAPELKKPIGVATTEKVAMSDIFFGDNVGLANNTGIKNAFIYGDELKTEEEARKFVVAAGYKGRLEDIAFINKKDLTYEELIAQVARQTGIAQENVGIRSVQGELKLSADKVTLGTLLEIESIEINGQQVYMAMNSYQALLRILVAEGEFEIPGVTKDDISGKYIFLPRTVPIDYDKEVRTYIEAITMIRTAA